MNYLEKEHCCSKSRVFEHLLHINSNYKLVYILIHFDIFRAIAELVSAEYKLLMEEQKEEDESSDDGYMFPNPDL